jgi:NitT/TauT family transport system permease protein
VLVLILLAWQILASNNIISALFFPPPSAIAQTFLKLAQSGDLLTHTTITFQRLLLGFGIGGGSGLLLGLGMGASRRIRMYFDPFVSALHPLPKIALFPLIVILFGIGETSKVVVITVATFFPMVINTMTGVLSINPTHFEVARNYGTSRLRTLWRITLPGSLPLILTGGRVALNIALLLTIAIEIISAREGLGAMIASAWRTFRITEMYASLIVIAGIGMLFNWMIYRLIRWLSPWYQERLQ